MTVEPRAFKTKKRYAYLSESSLTLGNENWSRFRMPARLQIASPLAYDSAQRIAANTLSQAGDYQGLQMPCWIVQPGGQLPR